jgi:hypothetical protein
MNDATLSFVHRLCLLIATIAMVAPALAVTSPSTSCVQPCDDDSPDGDCPPDCPECVCCPHLTSAIPSSAIVLVAVPAPSDRHVEAPQLLPPSTDPREITHVPKVVTA